MFYGATVFDPIIIIAQIVSMQCLSYLSLGMFQWLLLGSYVPTFSLYYFFDYHAVNVHKFSGWMVIVSFLANSIAGAGYLCMVVERAKKCLDFTATLYIVNLFICLFHTGLPYSLEWWVLQFTSLVIMSVLGEWLCMRREMREIPIISLSGRGSHKRDSGKEATSKGSSSSLKSMTRTSSSGQTRVSVAP
mmetsp:Transcript_22606/g.31505  ORF Transcript_22606/g.31505 Transcript_22606/m.31505 type:complete len:190 (+) Transcript_22606:236-805(+)